ncbi:hypothetical protein B0H10DRAFT_950556 [Mycena sp. CBHHK59/15]|nr:hypothetical protein B0H10DRAFT_950556 [Mycena sp. CBHHK59/15]
MGLRDHVTVTDTSLGMLSAATKSSLAEVLGLVQKTVLNAASELEDEAQSQVARIVSEANEARNERDEALKGLHAAQMKASKHENELSQMRAMIENLQREVTHWKEQAKNWQDHYTRVEQDRCGLSTELLTLSRSTVIKESPSKYSYIDADDSAPFSHIKRASTSSNRPPAYKSAIPPSPSESDSPLQSISTHPDPRTPANKSVKQPGSKSTRNELPPYQPTDAAASLPNDSRSNIVMRSTAKASTKQMQTPVAQSQAPPRQILVRRVQAVIHRQIKEEEEDEELYEEEEERPSSVRIERRRSGLVIQDDDESRSGSEIGEQERDDESGDELMLNRTQEVYDDGILPTPLQQ